MKKLVFSSGQGYSYSNEIGLFEVKNKTVKKQFNKLSEAIEYYNSIEDEKAIWDISTLPELLEAHSWSN